MTRAILYTITLAILSLPARAADAPKLDQVIIVFKTHFDIGYTKMASEVVQQYRTTMIDQALKVVDQSRALPPEQQFVWTIPGWPMSKILEDWPGQTPQRKERILAAFKEGRFVVHALPFTTHTELLELEDLVRGLGYSSRLSRMIGKELPRDAKMTDVPCHSWALVTILKHAGVDFLHLGCNAASRSPEVPRLFWWEGPDGSRLLTMYTAEGYGTGLVPPNDWRYKTWLALIHTGDNHGPPTPEEVKKILDEAKTKLPNVKVKIGRLSDFADAILAEKAEIPVVRGDMPDTWIHGPMSDPMGALVARDYRASLNIVQNLDTQLRAWGVGGDSIADKISEAYEKSLLYGEHTWGGALYWIRPYFAYGEQWKKNRAEGRFKRLEESWDEHTDYIRSLPRRMNSMPDRFADLARGVNCEGGRLVVYNPLPWKRSGIALTQNMPRGMTALKALDTGEIVHTSGLGSIPVKDIPPMGYRTYVPATTEAAPRVVVSESATTMENSFFKVQLDARHGTIKSLIDKRSGRELVDTGSSYGLGQYLYERFDADNVAAFVKAYVKINADWALNELGKPTMPPASEVPYRATSATDFSLRIVQIGPRTDATMLSPEKPGKTSVMTTVTLDRDQPWIDINMYVSNRPGDPWPQADWICLPLNVRDPQFRLARLGSIVDPTKDVVRGTNRHLFALNGGLAVIDSDGHGVGICSTTSPLVSLGEPGCWKYSLDYAATKPLVFVNLFNNQWTTNFRMWNGGSLVSTIRVWAIDKFDAEKDLITPSLDDRYAMFASWHDGPAGKLPISQSGLELSRKGILVTAFGPNPDGEGTVLRLWEHAGKSGPVEVRLPAGMRPERVQPVDLRGRPIGQAIAVKDGRFDVEVRGYAPVSLVIR